MTIDHPRLRRPIARRHRSLPRLPRIELPLPNGLEQRLRQIARPLSCDDLSRLYPAPENRGSGRDPAVELHLQSCRRCREVYGRLDIAYASARPAPSRRQLESWRRIASRSAGRGEASLLPFPLPGWVRDGRFGVAASLVMTVLMLLPIGSSSTQLLRAVAGTAETVVSESGRLLDDGRARGSDLWRELTARVDAGYESGKLSLTIHGRSYSRLYDRTLQLIGLGRTDDSESFVPTQGERYGQAT